MSKKSRYAGSTRSLMDKRISNRIEGKSKMVSVRNESQVAGQCRIEAFD